MKREYEGDKTRCAPWQCHPGLLSICLPVTFPYIIGAPPFPNTTPSRSSLPPSSFPFVPTQPVTPSSASTGELASSAYRHPANTHRIERGCRSHTHRQVVFDSRLRAILNARTIRPCKNRGGARKRIIRESGEL